MGGENRRRIITDSEEIIVHIAAETGLQTSQVKTIVAVFREAIDDLLATGYIVVTGELFLSFGDSPTRRGLLARLDGDGDVPEGVLRGDHVAVAEWIDVPFAVYVEHPLGNRPHVMARIVELHGDSRFDLDMLWTVLDEWDATFADGRPYQVSSAGLEVAVEHWLVDHLPRLRLHGFPVDLVHQQLILPSGRRPDLLCRFNDDTELAQSDDWLVVELKATRYYEAAADQILGYTDEVSQHLAHGHAVHALLITDGANHAQVERLRALGIEHVSLGVLGYRHHLAQERKAPREIASLSSPVGTTDLAISDATSLGRLGDAADFDGPTTYWVRLFWDQDGDESAERPVAADLWSKRESRRIGYEGEWGETPQWPAQHPTTLLDAPGTRWRKVAVCIRCDWLVRPTDLSNGFDLHDSAKEHALAHVHDPRLEVGENPTKPQRRNLRNALEEARVNARRRARRVQPRPVDED